MNFNLTNGTISSLTITTDNNIDSATVTGADYVINENTITLTNLTSSLVLELTGEISAVNKIHIGTLNTKNFYFGTLGVSAIYLGQYLVYAKGATEEATFKLSDGKYLYLSNGDYFDAEDIPMISFTIAGNAYQAEEGMTWYEWVNSEYNTIGAYTSATNATYPGYSVYTPSNSAVYLNYISSNNSFVNSSQTIINNTAYTITVSSGGAGF